MSDLAGDHFAREIGPAVDQGLARLGDHLLDTATTGRESPAPATFQIAFQMFRHECFCRRIHRPNRPGDVVFRLPLRAGFVNNSFVEPTSINSP